MAGEKSAGVGEYIKRAFLYRWNLLVFLAGAAAAALSPWPDALLPLVAAGELVYLTNMVSNPRFRQAIDAQVYQEGRPIAAHPAQRPIQEIVAALPPASRHRFDQLRGQCLEMREIASAVRGRSAGQPQPGEDLAAPALDRLLWVFLRLLVSQEALNHFLNRTDVREIQRRLDEAKARLESQQGGDERIVRSLQDSVAVQELRLDNYNKAAKNAEFVRVELDRIEAKIQALTEAGVNRQEPDFLTSQIDSVTESMASTEKAIGELNALTGVMEQMEEPPAILEADFREIRQR